MLNASTWQYKGHNKLVMMGYTNFKDHALIKRRRVDEKMNVMGEMFKDKHANTTKATFGCSEAHTKLHKTYFAVWIFL